MEQYIKKSALVAEIERRISNLEQLGNRLYIQTNFPEQYRLIHGYESILSFLDTLEVKEVDLEEKATQLSQKYFPDEENIWARANIEAQKCKSACIEMVEWLKAQKGE